MTSHHFRIISATRLCCLLLFRPSRFLELDAEDKNARKNCNNQNDRHVSSYIVRHAFFRSLLWVLVSSAIGYAIGMGFGSLFGCTVGKYVAWLQIAGAGLLLWGTLFVRGWEVLTYDMDSLTEKVNQWLYRFLYCAGTAILVCSLAWTGCRQ